MRHWLRPTHRTPHWVRHMHPMPHWGASPHPQPTRSRCTPRARHPALPRTPIRSLPAVWGCLSRHLSRLDKHPQTVSTIKLRGAPRTHKRCRRQATSRSQRPRKRIPLNGQQLPRLHPTGDLNPHPKLHRLLNSHHHIQHVISHLPGSPLPRPSPNRPSQIKHPSTPRSRMPDRDNLLRLPTHMHDSRTVKPIRIRQNRSPPRPGNLNNPRPPQRRIKRQQNLRTPPARKLDQRTNRSRHGNRKLNPSPRPSPDHPSLPPPPANPGNLPHRPKNLHQLRQVIRPDVQQRPAASLKQKLRRGMPALRPRRLKQRQRRNRNPDPAKRTKRGLVPSAQKGVRRSSHPHALLPRPVEKFPHSRPIHPDRLLRPNVLPRLHRRETHLDMHRGHSQIHDDLDIRQRQQIRYRTRPGNTVSSRLPPGPGNIEISDAHHPQIRKRRQILQIGVADKPSPDNPDPDRHFPTPAR